MAHKILYFFLFTSLIIVVVSDKTKNYGSFNVEVTKVELCKGPKQKNCGEYRMKITNIEFDIDITESLIPNKAKVLAISNGNEFMRLQISKPCDNMFMKPLLAKLFNINDNCLIKKGHYSFTLNYEEMLRSYYGGMHFYGIFGFKSMFYGDQCNLSCTIIEVKISKPGN